ncbi:MAG: hypothetical protein HC855_14720 [Rhizobiales bacterium]|nr:hypothetical protein [Hyphomicrobiales bacterium]
MSELTLCPLLDWERELLAELVEREVVEEAMVATQSRKLNVLVKTLRLRRFALFTGSAMDVDGDLTWEVTKSEREIRAWQVRANKYCYEVPRIYRLNINRRGFGRADRLPSSLSPLKTW